MSAVLSNLKPLGTKAKDVAACKTASHPFSPVPKATPTPQFTYGGPSSSGSSAFGQYSDNEKERKDSLYSLGSSVGQYYEKQAQREHIPAPQGGRGSNASSTTIPSPRTSASSVGKGGKHASKGKRIITENPASARTKTIARQ